MLDLDKGVLRRFHPSGAMISMYVDQPGTWYDDTGHEVRLEDAQAAGFDVESALRERAKKEKLEELRRKVESEYDPISEPALHMKDVGKNLWQIVDERGRELLEEPLSRLQAYERLQQMQADEVTTEDAAPEGRIRIVFAGPGKFRVKAPNGDYLCNPVTYEKARKIAEDLKGGQAEASRAAPAEVMEGAA